MPEGTSAGPCLQTYVEHADQAIIAGEARICRLALLTEAMAAAGYETRRIADLMMKHGELLGLWNARRSEIIDRLETAGLRTDFRHIDSGTENVVSLMHPVSEWPTKQATTHLT